jgi:hypothetical protein
VQPVVEHRGAEHAGGAEHRDDERQREQERRAAVAAAPPLPLAGAPLAPSLIWTVTLPVPWPA